MSLKQKIADTEVFSGATPGVEWPERKPLQRELAPPEPFPMDALSPTLKAASQKAHQVIQAAAAVCAFGFLAGANLATQAHGDLEVDGRVNPISCFFVSIAESGDRKSAVDGVALEAHRQWQREQRRHWSEEHDQFEIKASVYEAAKKKILAGRESSEEKNRKLSSLERPAVPIEPLILMSEPTYEGLYRVLAFGYPSIGLFSDEGGRLLGGHAMSQDNRLKTAAGLSGLWDRGVADRVRSGDGASILYGKRLSMHLMLQPGVSALLFADPMLKDQGLTARLLTVAPAFERKRYEPINLSQDVDVMLYQDRVRRLLRKPLSLVPGEKSALQPTRIKLAPFAKSLYERYHDSIQSQVGPGEGLSAVRAFASKAHDHAARIAATQAIFEDPDCREISVDHFQRAARIIDHCIAELLRLTDVNLIDQQLLEAHKLLSWLQKRERRLYSLVEIYKEGPNFVRSASKARSLLDVLYQHGEVRPSEDRCIYEGTSRRECWEVREQ